MVYSTGFMVMAYSTILKKHYNYWPGAVHREQKVRHILDQTRQYEWGGESIEEKMRKSAKL